MGKTKRRSLASALKFDARPDRADFRDRLYEPGLHFVPPRMTLQEWKRRKVPVLDQGEDGACTGFGLATVANALMGVKTLTKSVSPRMLYEMAKDYDEWPGDDYEGSSCKGAVKGWHKHGVCSRRLWPHKPGETELTDRRAADAALRPLGSYVRLNPTNLTHMRAAMAEVGGAIYVSGDVHEGWWEPDSDGTIRDGARAGGHAFALVGYDARGFWVQNSWGSRWGIGGCALLPYAQWLRDGYDAWAVRMGVPTLL